MKPSTMFSAFQLLIFSAFHFFNFSFFQLFIFSAFHFFSFSFPPFTESRSSKRVLDFASLPLYGKVFFLDLPRVKSESLATLAEKITHLGGTVEKFFHEAVCYLVTLRHMEGEKEGKEQTAASPDTRVKSGGKSAGMTSQQRSYNMRHEMLTQRALFCNRTNKKRGTLSQHFVTSVVPPLSPLEGSKSKKRAHDGYSGAKNVALSVSVRETTWPRYVFFL